MQNGVDIYPPFWFPYWHLLLVVAIIFAAVVLRLIIARYLKRLALRRQQQAIERAQAKDGSRVDQALVQLKQLQNAYQRGELSAAGAAEQASAVVRETYDEMMNHSTRFQAHYEIASRRLQKLAGLIKNTYPVEFAHTAHQIAPEAVERMFAEAREVVEACR